MLNQKNEVPILDINQQLVAVVLAAVYSTHGYYTFGCPKETQQNLQDLPHLFSLSPKAVTTQGAMHSRPSISLFAGSLRSVPCSPSAQE